MVYSQQSLFGMMQNVQTCPDCGGTGKVIREKSVPGLPGATGYISKKVRKTVEIPAGIDNGQSLENIGWVPVEMTPGYTNDSAKLPTTPELRDTWKQRHEEHKDADGAESADANADEKRIAVRNTDGNTAADRKSDDGEGDKAAGKK